VVIWYIFSLFGIFKQEKSGNPALYLEITAESNSLNRLQEENSAAAPAVGGLTGGATRTFLTLPSPKRKLDEDEDEGKVLLQEEGAADAGGEVARPSEENVPKAKTLKRRNQAMYTADDDD
jgi:hypothetical protein